MHARRSAGILIATGFVILAVERPLTLGPQRLVGLGQGQAATTPTDRQESPAAPLGKPRISRDMQVDDKDIWTTTDLELKPGERAVFAANGTAHCAGQDDEFGPAGLPRGFRDLLRVLPVSQAGRGALIGRIGESD